MGKSRGLRVAQCAFVLAAVAGLGCQSELADGTPSMNPNAPVLPFGSPDGSGSSNPGNPNNPGGVGQPNSVDLSENSQADRKPTLSTVSLGDTVDPATGAPLPVDQLAALDACATPGPRIIRRLTSLQYRNTLVSVFGSTDVPDAAVLRDPTTLGYNVDSDDSLIEGLDAGGLMTLGEDVATWALANGKVEQLSNNCMDLNNNNCKQTLVKNLGEKISREPLDQARVDSYVGLFDPDGADVTDFKDGAALVIAAMVQSPYLLYRRELGPLDRNTQDYALTPFEVASELSYFLTNSPPDTALIDAAKQSRLGSNDDIDREAARLMATDASKDVFARFVRSWTDIDRLTGKAKAGRDDLTPEVRADMLEETTRFFADVLGRPDGTVADLFSANYTFLNKRLTDFYGIAGSSSDNFEKIDIADGRRVPGLLGQGSYLTAHALADNSSPVQRAFVVRERFLCNDLPEVPVNLNTNLAAPVATDTSRERYSRHSTEEPCHTCHALMDPIGFTFEHYDSFGVFRATEAGKPVDSSGGVPIMDGSVPRSPALLYPLDGVEGLATYLSEIENVRACLINNLAYFSYGIANDTKWNPAEKACTDNTIRQEARDSGNTLQSVVSGILHAPHFTRRVRDVDG